MSHYMGYGGIGLGTQQDKKACASLGGKLIPIPKGTETKDGANTLCQVGSTIMSQGGGGTDYDTNVTKLYNRINECPRAGGVLTARSSQLLGKEVTCNVGSKQAFLVLGDGETIPTWRDKSGKAVKLGTSSAETSVLPYVLGAAAVLVVGFLVLK
tara:strand:+ start:799 stop:1263 length:465 start_codon:yes stop_codon:yes gene_type:complete